MSWGMKFVAGTKAKALEELDRIERDHKERGYGAPPEPVMSAIRSTVGAMNEPPAEAGLEVESNGHIEPSGSTAWSNAKISVSFVRLLALLLAFIPALALAQEAGASSPVLDVKGGLWALFLQYVVPALFTAIAAVVTAGGAALVALVKTKTKNETIAGMLDRIIHTVQTVVLDVNGTVKVEYLELTKDGDLSAADKARLKAVALDRVKSHLGSAVALIPAVFGITPEQIDSFLGSHIEAAVESLNRTSRPATPATPANP